jgi:hypothetical protein
MEFIPDLEICHKRQTLGMEGLNLAEKRRRQILTCAPKTPLSKIQKIDDLHFEVKSSASNKIYQINLDTTTCSCSDFPRIRLCKHIAAIAHFFGGADLGPRPPGNAGASELVACESPDQQDSSVSSTDDGATSTTASVLSAANDIIGLSQVLISNVPRDPRIARSLDSIRSRLSALVHSATAAGDGSHLPEKESIGPNQRTWPETAARMGVKRGNKPCEKGKVDSALTAQHIGVPNCKRPTDNDPYGAGEQSGKRAKPDARSAAANVRARAAAEERAVKAEPPLTQPPPPSQLPPLTQPLLPASLPLPMSLPSHVSFAPYTYNPYNYQFHHPLSQPMYSHSQGSPSAPPYYPAFRLTLTLTTCRLDNAFVLNIRNFY